MTTFSNTLKLLRKNAGLTQEELSKHLNVSRSTIGMYEHGSREPDYEMLEVIADYFNVDIDYLLGRTLKTTKRLQSTEMSEDEYKKTFSKKLKYYMSINNKTQIDIINDLNINKSAISTWCNGTRLPRMDKVQMLADYFRINKSDLLEDKPETTYLDKLDHETLKQLNDENIVKVNNYSCNLLNVQKMEEPVLMAAHNDFASDPEEQKKIMEDLKKLKRPNT